MHDTGIIWPPRVGDIVTIRGTDLVCIVERIEGAGADRRYILEVCASGSHHREGARRNASDAGVDRTEYALHQLEPAH